MQCRESEERVLIECLRLLTHHLAYMIHKITALVGIECCPKNDYSQ